MAVTLNTQHEIKRGDVIFLHPDDVIVDTKLRGRVKAPSKDDVESLAESILEHGQQQPVSVRKLADKRVQLVYGYTRYAAVQLLRERGHDTLLKVTVTTCNDAEAFMSNVVENKHRNATTPIDDAHNQRRLREEHGMADAAIAKLYRVTAGWVGQMAKLLLLPKDVQSKIEAGQLPVSAALLLAEVSDPAKQKELLEEVEEPGTGKVKGAALKKLLREQNEGEEEGEGGDDPPVKPQKLTRSVKDIRDFFLDLTTPEDETDAVKDFAHSILQWIEGRKGDRSAYNAVKKLEGGK